MKPKETIKGNRINECLFEKDMSRAELIEITGLDSGHVSKIINNAVPSLSLPIAHKIAKALGFPIEVVFIL